MHLEILRSREIRIELIGMFLWLDDRADAQAVDVNALEALSEAGGYALHTDFAGSVNVHGLGGRVFGQGKVRVVDVAFGVADAVGGDGGGEDDFLDSEFAGGFDDVW